MINAMNLDGDKCMTNVKQGELSHKYKKKTSKDAKFIGTKYKLSHV